MKFCINSDPMGKEKYFVFENTRLRKVRDIFESMNPDQKNVLFYLVGKAIEKDNDAKFPSNFKVKKVIFNDPATIVFFEDGDKIVVKKMKGEAFDPEKGLAMAISKKVLGEDYKKIFKKNCKEYHDTLSAFTTFANAFTKVARSIDHNNFEFL